MNFAAIDFETANEGRDSACSLGLVIVEKNKVVDKKYWLIRPKNLRFNPINISIHGITKKDVENQPEFNELWPQIKEIIDNKVVIAHNASFDMSVLRHVLSTYNIEFPSLKYACTVQIAKKAWPQLLSHRLNIVSEYLGVSLNHHNALEDAYACSEVARRAIISSNASCLDSLLNKLGLTYGTMFPGGYTACSSRGSGKGRARAK